MACSLVKTFRKKKNAKKLAKSRHKKGLKARVRKTAKGYTVSTC